MNKSSLFENQYDELCKKVIHGYNLLLDMGAQYLSSSIKQKSKVLSIGCGTANEIFAMKKYKNQYNFIGYNRPRKSTGFKTPIEVESRNSFVALTTGI